MLTAEPPPRTCDCGVRHAVWSGLLALTTHQIDAPLPRPPRRVIYSGLLALTTTHPADTIGYRLVASSGRLSLDPVVQAYRIIHESLHQSGASFNAGPLPSRARRRVPGRRRHR